MNVYKTARLCDGPVAWIRPLRVDWQADCEVGLFSTHRITILRNAASAWRIGHTITGLEANEGPADLCSPNFSGLISTRRAVRRGDDE